jgi:hypothetical protein
VVERAVQLVRHLAATEALVEERGIQEFQRVLELQTKVLTLRPLEQTPGLVEVVLVR